MGQSPPPPWFHNSYVILSEHFWPLFWEDQGGESSQPLLSQPGNAWVGEDSPLPLNSTSAVICLAVSTDLGILPLGPARSLTERVHTDTSHAPSWGQSLWKSPL